MAKKASLFDTIKQHIRNNATERLNGWKSNPYYNEETVNKAFDQLDEDLKTMNPHMAIYGNALKKVLKSGRFKNQFQTHTSEGRLSANTRAEHTNKHFGTPLRVKDFNALGSPVYAVDKNLKNSEKYGYLGPATDDVYGYGNYQVDFKPSVKERMTAHIGDSLGSGTFSFVPGDRETYPGILRDVAYRYDSPRNYMRDFNKGNPLSKQGQYLEAQFHGPLTTGDINSIQVRRSQVDPEIVKYSTANYIPLYDEQGCYNACYDVAGNPIWIPKD